MKKLIILSLALTMTLTSAFAQEGDLVLQGEKWIATHTGYVCDTTGTKVEAPASFNKLNVIFEKITTDASLDNGLIKASFVENGKACRYNAFVFADNSSNNIRLVESKAYAPMGDSECFEGKAMLDAALESNAYLYYGHPHNLAIMVPAEGAEAVCGSPLIGINFIVSGRVR
jgi:hypothetical protein